MRLNYLPVLFPLLATVDNSQRERNCKRQELSVKENRRSSQESQKLMIKVTKIVNFFHFPVLPEHFSFIIWKTWELVKQKFDKFFFKPISQILASLMIRINWLLREIFQSLSDEI